MCTKERVPIRENVVEHTLHEAQNEHGKKSDRRAEDQQHAEQTTMVLVGIPEIGEVPDHRVLHPELGHLSGDRCNGNQQSCKSELVRIQHLRIQQDDVDKAQADTQISEQGIEGGLTCYDAHFDRKMG